MKFCDEAIIEVKAGSGGNGSPSFRREKYISRGGPDGGHGGRGGNIIVEGDENQNTLASYLAKKHYKAEAGDCGLGRNMTGINGEDTILKVPVGTLVYDNATNKLIADITHHGQQIIAARGGMGGKGNLGFTTSIRRAPDFAELGEPGEKKMLKLELKLIAEVAIMGYPRVGKSTLISRISNARPKIADYPFTTLIPNLGTVKVDDTDFVVADIPGLIEGAHEGKGLGIEFLKHIERTKILIHLLDITHDDLKTEYKNLNKELKLFSKELAKKPQMLVVNKVDATIPEIIDETKKIFKKEKPLFISSVSGEGIKEFLYKLKDIVRKHRHASQTRNPKSETRKEHKVFRPHLDLPDIRNYTVEKFGDGFRVSGKRIEQMAIMTDMSRRGAKMRILDVLKKIGAQRELVKLGAIDGDKITIGERVFEFMKD